MILAPTAADPALWLADALAAAESVDHVLGHGLVEALPVLLGNEDSGKHGGTAVNMTFKHDWLVKSVKILG